MSDIRHERRRQSLLDSAYDLFLEKGVFSTTISDIVQHADVAKGTFYLYFKDKDDIFHALVDRISSRIIIQSEQAVLVSQTPDFTERMVLFADLIIEYFKQYPMVLRMLDRHFSWPRLTQQLQSSTDPTAQALMEDIRTSPVVQRMGAEEAWRLAFILLEMVGATCYSSIIENRPAPIDQMKPLLYGIIRTALSPTADAAIPDEKKAGVQ